jgi:hypothetical protein
MKKKILISSSIFFFLPVMLTLLQGCICGGRKFDKYFEVTKMAASPRYSNTPYDNQPVTTGEISIQIYAFARYYSFESDFSGSALMACSPIDPVSKETITNIEIFSNKDFEGFPAGTNLTSLFRIGEMYASQNFDEYLSSKPKSQQYYNIAFSSNARPVSGEHQFTIFFTDSKKRVFEMNTTINFQ